MVGKKDSLTVMFLIGNGFDMGVLDALDKEYKTTYKEFYDYLSYFLINKDNCIYKKIVEKNTHENDKWLDYELLLSEIVKDKREEIAAEINSQNKEKIYNKFLEEWKEIQYKFADFLNYVVTPETLKEVSELDGKSTLEKFIGDLSEKECQNIIFPKYTGHHIEINYKIFNFNYSTLADNYFYWLFDHHPFSSSGNNAHFYPNPQDYSGCKGEKDTSFFLKANIEFYHPHGHISIPESILFGMSINKEKYSSSKLSGWTNYPEELSKKLDKSYWVNVSQKVRPTIEETDLYIIYGCSIGESDKWWWEEIINNLVLNNKEVIIYEYGNQELKDKFLSYCCEENREEVAKKVFVVNFDDENLLDYAFNFTK